MKNPALLAKKRSFRTAGWYGLILVLAVGLSLISQNFVRPVDCRGFCGAPKNSACPSGTCRFYEQRAGLPLPYRVDFPGGGSPTSGWGILGPEDMPNPFFFLADVFFYGLVLWLVGYLIRVRGGRKALDRLAILLPLGIIVAFLVVGFLLYRPVLGG